LKQKPICESTETTLTTTETNQQKIIIIMLLLHLFHDLQIQFHREKLTQGNLFLADRCARALKKEGLGSISCILQ